MSKEKLKKLIDKILAERRDRVYEKMDQVTNNIIIQLEELKELGNFHQYTIPDDFEVYEKPKTEPTIDTLYRFIRKLSLSANQLDLINNFLEGINHFCTRAALFLLRDDKLVGWKGKGFSGTEGDIGDEEIKKIFFSLSANTIFKYVLDHQKPYSGPPQSQPDDHIVYSRFGGRIPEKIFTLPFFVKGKPQAVIYTDTFEGKPIGQKEIEIIAVVGEMSLDLLPLRQKILAKVKTHEYEEEKPGGEIKISTVEDADDRTVASIKENDPERLARVIINDIYLYNKSKVDRALKSGENLFDALQNTIMQSRELYLNKFNDLSPFERQLVDTLAKGNRILLKGYHFETL
jgi:hypothetical protein